MKTPDTKGHIPKDRKQLVVARASGRGNLEVWIFLEGVCVMDNVLELEWVAAGPHEYSKTLCVAHFKMVKNGKFYLNREIF